MSARQRLTGQMTKQKLEIALKGYELYIYAAMDRSATVNHYHL